mmetsp:Transcript_51646/g.123052  ORF Transcript_51646/g.123052 Transcript_51646/m.123052 type:complete len:233 (-) Transcript_51646:1482-2180(-)
MPPSSTLLVTRSTLADLPTSPSSCGIGTPSWIPSSSRATSLDMTPAPSTSRFSPNFVSSPVKAASSISMSPALDSACACGTIRTRELDLWTSFDGVVPRISLLKRTGTPSARATVNSVTPCMKVPHTAREPWLLRESAVYSACFMLRNFLRTSMVNDLDLLAMPRMNSAEPRAMMEPSVEIRANPAPPPLIELSLLPDRAMPKERRMLSNDARPLDSSRLFFGSGIGGSSAR